MKNTNNIVSSRVEFFIVIIGAFGYPMLGSILSVLTPRTDGSAAIRESGLHALLAYEIPVVIILVSFLYLRGWNLRKLGFVPSIRDSGIGVGLAIFAYITYAVIWLLFAMHVPGLEGQADNMVAPGLGLTTVIAVSVLNPIYEELFVCGYLIEALRKTRGISFAINVSIGVRLVYHLYQGTLGVISIIPMGFIFAYWYARTGRLWPVVIAHGIFDFVALVAYVKP